jgi:hypothetical protein
MAYHSTFIRLTTWSIDRPYVQIDRFEDDEDDPAAAYMIALDEKKAAAAVLEAKKAQSVLLAAAAGVPAPPEGEDYDSDEEVKKARALRGCG